MRKILIQLIGEQTLPNIFPILSINPDAVVNIFTDKTRKQHRTIMNWCRQYGEKYNIHPEFIQTAPVKTSLSEIQQGIGRVLQNEMEKLRDEKDTMLILNMTGGTKSMSACAISYCMQISNRLKQEGYQPLPVVYLNPENGEIEFITESGQKENVLVRAPHDVKLSVAEIIDAAGTAQMVSARKDWQQVYPCARALLKIANGGLYFTLNEVNQDNFASYASSPISALLRDNDKERRERAKAALQELADKTQQDETLSRGFALCGFVARDGDFYFSDDLQKKVAELEILLSADDLKKHQKYEMKKAMSRQLGNAANLFVGGWWEVIVAHAYQLENPQAEVLWSVETATRNDLDHAVETDIIATDGHALCCISCKRGIHAQVTQELEQHCTRTGMLGGVMHQRIIAVFRRDAEWQLNSLARALRLTMWSSKKVQAIEEGKKYEEKPLVEKVKDESAVQSNNPTRKEPEASLPFTSRLRQAFRLLLTGKTQG